MYYKILYYLILNIILHCFYKFVKRQVVVLHSMVDYVILYTCIKNKDMDFEICAEGFLYG